MRPLPLVLGIFAALLSVGTRAEAQNYPWCAYYGGFDGENASHDLFLIQIIEWFPLS